MSSTIVLYFNFVYTIHTTFMDFEHGLWTLSSTFMVFMCIVFVSELGCLSTSDYNVASVLCT